MMLLLPGGYTLSHLHTVGVDISPESLAYVMLHRGVTVVQGKMRLDADTKVVSYDGRLGRMMLAAAPCSWLNADGRCEHYESRPWECRDFERHTAHRYLVPLGCKMDSCGLGEDVREVVKLAREAQDAVQV
jgi:hypothetical protein